MEFCFHYRTSHPMESYFCHICNARKAQNQVAVMESGDIRCLTCNSSGFVEKVNEAEFQDSTQTFFQHGTGQPQAGQGFGQQQGSDPFSSVFGVPLNTFVQNVFQGTFAIPMNNTDPNVPMHIRFAQDYTNFFNQHIAPMFDGQTFTANTGDRTFQQLDISSIMNSFFANPYNEQAMNQIIQFVMENDPNRYGPPPAAKHVVEALEVEELTEISAKKLGTCAICTEDFKGKEKIHWLTQERDKCGHPFHVDCIIPWLKEHNTCPVCRFELPTDDETYNTQREYLRARMQEELRRNANTRGNAANNRPNP